MNSPRPMSKLSQFESNLLRQKLFRLIKEKSFSRGRFVLASGQVSNYYLDMKPTMFDPEGANALSEMILDRLYDVKVDYVGGLALGAVPLISTLTMLSGHQNRPIRGFFVRKEVKDHGTMKLIEGLTKNESLQGKNIVILDDVTTTGSSAMAAAEAAQESGANIIRILSIVDREEGAVEFYREKGIPFEALFVASEFLNS
jgi:orotate phosphoribosyltransferase